VTDNDATRGMVRQVRFLVTVEEVPEVAQPKGKSTGRAAASTSKDTGEAPAGDRSDVSDPQEKA
jgi:hypothetical protein